MVLLLYLHFKLPAQAQSLQWLYTQPALRQLGQFRLALPKFASLSLVAAVAVAETTTAVAAVVVGQSKF
jgi:hypothetical protein